jgi:hypothetical protein
LDTRLHRISAAGQLDSAATAEKLIYLQHLGLPATRRLSFQMPVSAAELAQALLEV